MPQSQPLEERALQLVEGFQKELTNALNSLGRKQSRGVHDNYYFRAAAHVNAAAEGFVFLRRAHRLNATKFLIRPAIEAVFRLEAVRRKAELLFRVAYSERLEDLRWFRRVADNAGKSFDEQPSKLEWKEFKRAYAEQCPSHDLLETAISSFDLAAEAGLGAYYDSHYRMYCQYEHAAFRATAGFLKEISDPADCRTVAWCVFVAVNALASMEVVETPNLTALHDRLDRLDNELSKSGP